MLSTPSQPTLGLPLTEYVNHNGGLSHRLTMQNLYRSAPRVPFGFGYVAQMSGVPQLVVPIGQVPYESTITNHTEYLPISISLYAAAGCDYMLWDLAAALQVSNM
jgi:Asp-tRNA(Asn)/Glu-tRNA(Gln) amidotransferase A subunit family amidase